MTLYKGKYRIESTRLNKWDYSRAGYYFVTICSKNGVCFFGDVIDKKIRLSEIGKIVAEEWQKTEHIRDNIILDEWVMMPNHIHGIIVIKYQISEMKTEQHSVSEKQLKPNSLGSVIGQFKSVCTKRIREQGFRNFGWQARFYDRIIRDEDALHKARKYIRNNFLRWETDKENHINLFM